jgi:hypothetical protein
VNVSGWIRINSTTIGEITAADLTVNNKPVSRDPQNPLRFTLDPLIHVVPNPVRFEVTAHYNATLNFNRTLFLDISDAPPKNLLWNTTTDFNTSSSTNCTIDTHRVTLQGFTIAYDFTEDQEGTEPIGWDITNDTDTYCYVIESYFGHQKVLKFYDNKNPGAATADNSFTGQSSGAIEFWIYGGQTTHGMLKIFFNDTATTEIYTWYDIDAEKLYYQVANGSIYEICDLTDDAWWHLQYTFECSNGSYDGLSADTFSVYVNGARQGNYTFKSTVDTLDKFRFATCSDCADDFYFWVDAVDYSWATGYYPYRSYEYYGEETDNGTWTSNIFDTEVNSPYYENITFSCVTPTSTAIYLSYRLSNNGSTWDAWSAWSSANISIGSYEKRFFQVRALLNTTTPNQTPTLFYIRVNIYCF